MKRQRFTSEKVSQS
jgi:hypothetical protein